MADQIKTLLALDDTELGAKLGHAHALAEFKESLTRADALEGDARKKVEDRLDDMLNPTIYADSLKYAVESAERKAKGKTGPADVLEGCCDVCPD